MRNDESLPDVDGMLVFLRIVESGSFSGAARRLGRSKASVSRQVKALESRLGSQLLRRTTRRMSLTEEGRLFLERCRHVLEAAEAAEQSVHEIQAEPHGLLRIAVSISFGFLQLAPRLHRFLARHPSVRVEVEATDRVVDLVHERFDLSMRIRRPTERSYVIRKICPIRGLVCASPAYLERHGTPLRPADVLDHECLTYRGPTETWKFLNGEQYEVRGRLAFDNGDAQRAAVLSGLGLATLPTYLVGDDVREGRLVPLLLDETHPGPSLFAVYPESRHLSPRVRAMIDWLVEEFGPEPEWDRDLPVAGRHPGRLVEAPESA